MAQGEQEDLKQRFPDEAQCNACGTVCMTNVSSYVVLCKWHCHCQVCDLVHQNARTACPYCSVGGGSRWFIPTQATSNLEEQWRNEERDLGGRLRTIVMVASDWGNIMETSFTLVRDIAERFGKWRRSRIFCICDGCSENAENLAASSGFVLLKLTNEDNFSLAKLLYKVGRVDVLMGLVPKTLDLTIYIKNALPEPPGKLILLIDGNVRECMNQLKHAGVDLIYSLGSLIHQHNDSIVSEMSQRHLLLVPRLNQEFKLSVRDTPTGKIFVMIFPQVLGRMDYDLFISAGLDIALKVFDIFRSRHISVGHVLNFKVFVSRNFGNNTTALQGFIGRFTDVTNVAIVFVSSEYEWNKLVLQASVCVCPSTELVSHHWIYALIDNNVPYLVSSNSAIGNLIENSINSAGPSPAVRYDLNKDEYIENWVSALVRVFNSIDTEKIRHAVWKKNLMDTYMSDVDPLYASVFDALRNRLILNPSTQDIKILNKNISRHFRMMERSGCHVDLLDTAVDSIISKCEYGVPIQTTDLEAERKMIEVYNRLKEVGQILVAYESGSIVLKTLNTFMGSQNSFADDELVAMVEQTLITKDLMKQDGKGTSEAVADTKHTATVSRRKSISNFEISEIPVESTKIFDRNIPIRRERLEVNRIYEYDIFIAYNSCDGEVVTSQLCSELEKYDMKCHTNADFLLGESISEAIDQAMTNSAKIVFVVTQRFLSDRWTQYEVNRALSEVYRRRETIILPVLCGVTPTELPKDLADIKSVILDLDSSDGNLVQDLAEMIRQPPEPLGEQIMIPNIGYDLAWAYYYEYLKVVLPDLHTRMTRFASDVADSRFHTIYKKMIIVLTLHGYSPPSLSDIDPKIEMAGQLPYKADRAGNMQRDYSSTVWKIPHPDYEAKYYAVVEFASPLMSLYEMTEGKIAGLSEESKRYQIDLLVSTLMEIINHPQSGCQDKVTFVRYDGPCKNPQCTRDDNFKWKIYAGIGACG